MNSENNQPEKELSQEEELRFIKYVIDSPVARMEGETFEEYKQRRKFKNWLYKIPKNGKNIDIA